MLPLMAAISASFLSFIRSTHSGIDAPTALTKAICLAEQAYGIDMTAIKPVVLRGVPTERR